MPLILDMQADLCSTDMTSRPALPVFPAVRTVLQPDLLPLLRGATLPSRHVPPSAAALIESLRGTGYSPETALADLIDNSIAAGAGRVDLSFDWNDGKPFAAVTDDGGGMSEHELVAAMRFGGAGPRVARAATDLGRFGLGLKTASLSQCRRLTVASLRDGVLSTFCWDIDHVQKAGDAWELLEGATDELLPHIEPLRARASGTIVLWDRMDFGRVRERPTYNAFLAQLERAERHLAMVFHRFLNGDARKLQLTINSRRVRAWDPFVENRDATIARPEQVLDSGGERIRVRGFILPHPDRFANASEMEDAAGPEGWTAQQGFYVYRQKRLLSAGGWLGLGGTRAWTREEFSRLARIRIDLPNTIDEDWRIDIRKAQARPPEALRQDLSRIAEDVRRIARDVFIHRGRRTERDGETGTVTRVWQVNPPDATRRYVLRRDHPFATLIAGRLGDRIDLLEAFLQLIERTVPVDRIYLDAVEKGPMPLAKTPSAEHSAMLDTARGIVRTMMSAGLDRISAVAAVCRMEPFDSIEDIELKLGQKLFATEC